MFFYLVLAGGIMGGGGERVSPCRKQRGWDRLWASPPLRILGKGESIRHCDTGLVSRTGDREACCANHVGGAGILHVTFLC